MKMRTEVEIANFYSGLLLAQNKENLVANYKPEDNEVSSWYGYAPTLEGFLALQKENHFNDIILVIDSFKNKLCKEWSYSKAHLRGYFSDLSEIKISLFCEIHGINKVLSPEEFKILFEEVLKGIF